MAVTADHPRFRAPSRRRALIGVVVLVIAGLLLRLIPWGLPLWAHHSGGGLLWGAMIFCLVAALRPTSFGSTIAILVTAGVIVASVELFRLYHGPALDALRTTLSGQLLLGHIFSPWNILVDEVGVLTGALAMASTQTQIRD